MEPDTTACTISSSSSSEEEETETETETGLSTCGGEGICCFSFAKLWTALGGRGNWSWILLLGSEQESDSAAAHGPGARESSLRMISSSESSSREAREATPKKPRR